VQALEEDVAAKKEAAEAAEERARHAASGLALAEMTAEQARADAQR
jgi:hypothetical protein